MPATPRTLAPRVQRSLLHVTQTAVSCGLGLLLAGRMGRPAQKITAATLIGLGCLVAVPAAVELVSQTLNRPGSARGMRRRLEGIRRVPSYPDEVEVF